MFAASIYITYINVAFLLFFFSKAAKMKVCFLLLHFLKSIQSTTLIKVSCIIKNNDPIRKYFYVPIIEI
jgi:hypothetical protein